MKIIPHGDDLGSLRFTTHDDLQRHTTPANFAQVGTHNRTIDIWPVKVGGKERLVCERERNGSFNSNKS